MTAKGADRFPVRAWFFGSVFMQKTEPPAIPLKRGSPGVEKGEENSE